MNSSHAHPDSGGLGLRPGTRLGEFVIRGLIGEGGFGIVYLAYDTQLQRNVALKEYIPAALVSRVDGLKVTVRSESDEASRTVTDSCTIGLHSPEIHPFASHTRSHASSTTQLQEDSCTFST
jgi:hypothetical protein